VTLPCAFLLLTLGALFHGAPGEYSNVQEGGVAAGSVGTSPAGDSAFLQLGGASYGLESLAQRHWLIQWSALAAIEGGALANAKPYLSLIGGQVNGAAEADYRFARDVWSLYLGAGLSVDVSALAHPGLSWEGMARLNNVDGVGGLHFLGDARVPIGASFLFERHALLVALFGQEEVEAGGFHTPSQAFTGMGVWVRYDLANQLSVELTTSGGSSATTHNPALGISDHTVRTKATALIRYVLSSGVWLAAQGSLAQDRDFTSYGSARYATSDAPIFLAALQVGVPLALRDRGADSPAPRAPGISLRSGGTPTSASDERFCCFEVGSADLGLLSH
jgi:hypothetical protein